MARTRLLTWSSGAPARPLQVRPAPVAFAFEGQAQVDLVGRVDARQAIHYVVHGLGVEHLVQAFIFAPNQAERGSLVAGHR